MMTNNICLLVWLNPRLELFYTWDSSCLMVLFIMLTWIWPVQCLQHQMWIVMMDQPMITETTSSGQSCWCGWMRDINWRLWHLLVVVVMLSEVSESRKLTGESLFLTRWSSLSSIFIFSTIYISVSLVHKIWNTVWIQETSLCYVETSQETDWCWGYQVKIEILTSIIQSTILQFSSKMVHQHNVSYKVQSGSS